MTDKPNRFPVEATTYMFSLVHRFCEYRLFVTISFIVEIFHRVSYNLLSMGAFSYSGAGTGVGAGLDNF